MRSKLLFHIIGIALISVMCAACSPQQRLTRLLTHHPELRVRDTVLHREITAEIPHMQRDTGISVADAPCNCDSVLAATIHDTVRVSAGNATAALSYSKGQLTLRAEQQPDTIHQDVDINVPVVEYVEVERKETPLQAFFRISGIIFWGILAVLTLLFILKIIKRFVL